jgi:hypothetical protein
MEAAIVLAVIGTAGPALLARDYAKPLIGTIPEGVLSGNTSALQFIPEYF